MIDKQEHKNVTWIDLENPTKDEIRQILNEYELPPALVSDLETPVPRSEAVVESGTVKLTMDFPTVHRSDTSGPHEIKFLVAKKYLITVRYGEDSAVDGFKKQFDMLTTLKKTSKTLDGADVCIALLDCLYRETEEKLDYVQSILTDMETDIFDTHEKDMVFRFSEMSRRLIAFRQTLKTHDDVFRDAKPHFESVFTKRHTRALEKLHMHYFYLLRRTGTLFETLEDFRNTNLALLTTKQNEIMKTLTIMAFITFPLTLFTSMFGMNTKTTPILGQAGDFWVIVAIMIAATIVFFIFFKWKKWM